MSSIASENPLYINLPTKSRQMINERKDPLQLTEILGNQKNTLKHPLEGKASLLIAFSHYVDTNWHQQSLQSIIRENTGVIMVVKIGNSVLIVSPIS